MTEIIDKVLSHLKQNKIHYKLEEQTIYLEISSSILSAIFVEDETTVQFYAGEENDVYKYYQQHIFENVDEYLIDEIDQLIDFVKQKSSIINKIKRKVDDIIQMCEEEEMDYENFITVNYEI